MGKLPILDFEPIFKEVVWGGQRLRTKLNKELPGDSPFGESWEVVDLPSDQSVVRSGPLSGTALADLRSDRSEELLGGVELLQGRFPLLFKFIDAQKTLSVQVHPNEDACERLGGDARPKTEAWYIIDREPGSVLYAGLRPGVNRGAFDEAVRGGDVEPLLYKLAVEPGDFVFLPAGTIHAIGAGILLAEVQQSSDTTYRVFDWNRMGLDGKPRQLHVAEALESIDFGTWGAPVAQKPESGRPGVVSPYFSMETVEVTPTWSVRLEGEGPLVLMGIKGAGTVEISAGGEKGFMKLGQTRLVPAAIASDVELTSVGLATLLSVRIPSS